MKGKLFLIAGLILCLALGFVIGRLWSSPIPEIERSGINVRAMTGFNEGGRSLELSEAPIVTVEHILWYDWKSNIFALDAAMLGDGVFENALWWDGGYRLVVTVDDVIVHGIRYADAGMMMDAEFGQELTIFSDRVLFYGDAKNLGGYDGSLARLYSVDGLGRGRLNTRIYYELAKAGRLLEQINSRYVIAEFDNATGQDVQSQFSIEDISIVTFEPTSRRVYNHDPIIVEVTDLRTGETVLEFTHLFLMAVSVVMAAGEYGIHVSGGGFVSETYVVSGIAIPEL